MPGKRLLQHVSDTEGLSDKPPQFVKDRACAVRPEVDLPAMLGTLDDSRFTQDREISLERTG